MKSTGDLLNTTSTGIKRPFVSIVSFALLAPMRARWGCSHAFRTNKLPYQRQLSRMRGAKPGSSGWLSDLVTYDCTMIAWSVRISNFKHVGTRLHMSCLDDQETSVEVLCLEMSITLDIIVGLIRFCYMLYFYLWYAIILLLAPSGRQHAILLWDKGVCRSYLLPFGWFTDFMYLKIHLFLLERFNINPYKSDEL